MWRRSTRLASFFRATLPRPPPPPSIVVGAGPLDADGQVPSPIHFLVRSGDLPALVWCAMDRSTPSPFPARTAIQTALARILGGDPWGADSKDWTVPLGPFAEGRPGLEPGRKGEFVPVFEDQPTTIIAYR